MEGCFNLKYMARCPYISIYASLKHFGIQALNRYRYPNRDTSRENEYYIYSEKQSPKLT